MKRSILNTKKEENSINHINAVLYYNFAQYIELRVKAAYIISLLTLLCNGVNQTGISIFKSTSVFK